MFVSAPSPSIDKITSFQKPPVLDLISKETLPCLVFQKTQTGQGGNKESEHRTKIRCYSVSCAHSPHREKSKICAWTQARDAEKEGRKSKGATNRPLITRQWNFFDELESLVLALKNFISSMINLVLVITDFWVFCAKKIPFLNRPFSISPINVLSIWISGYRLSVDKWSLQLGPSKW